jgi:metal-sulfur cluster biosynthetic enzyme
MAAADSNDPRAEQIEALLSTVEDPELGLDVVNLGLVYAIAVDAEGVATVTYSLTNAACPYQPELEREMAEMARQAEGVREVRFELTFKPPWHPSMISDEARWALGYPPAEAM